MVAMEQIGFEQIEPKSGWCEHDPLEILHTVTHCIDTVMARGTAAGEFGPGDVAAIGITNQRETTIVWDMETGLPLHNAIVWLDLRTAEIVTKLESEGGTDRFRPVCGLPLSTYFSGVKLRWLLDHVPAVATAAAEGRALFGTVESWLIWNLSGGTAGGVHITDVSNASRTMLMELSSCSWHAPTCAAFRVPEAMLPRIVSNSQVYCNVAAGALAGVPIAAALGDQQAATLGQGCFKTGEAKNTYGTGCFMLMTAGIGAPVASTHGLLSTVGFQLGPDAPVTYCLEGSIAIAGAGVQWLRDKLEIIESAGAIGGDGKGLIDSVDSSAGVVFVPAFTGLFAPHWRSDARGLMIGITQVVNPGRAPPVPAPLPAAHVRLRWLGGRRRPRRGPTSHSRCWRRSASRPRRCAGAWPS
jgi:glycerol kinase